MEFDDLKSSWQKAGKSTKSAAELQLMTQVQQHPRLRRIRLKLLIEAVLITAFLLLYRDIFDGAEKPLWANICLLLSAVLFILNDLLGYFTLQKPVSGPNLLRSIENLRSKLGRLLVSSISTSLLFGASLILFFSAGIEYTPAKYLLLAGMILSLFALTYMSYKNWSNRIQHIQKAAEEFEGGE